MADVTAHTISLAVWDLESPLVLNTSAKIKVGATCSEGCVLEDQIVEIHDRVASLASGTLGPESWPGTAGLYWTELEFVAPSVEGPHMFKARLTATGLECSHAEASAAFSFVGVRPPERCITVRAVDNRTETGVPDVDVRFGIYRCRTNSSGIANVEVPAGSYEIVVYKLGYQAPPREVTVDTDLNVQISLELEPELEQEYWK